MSKKYVYFFGGDENEGAADMQNLLGEKGASLVDMASLGIDVPPGFTITTEACNYFFKNDFTLPPTLLGEIRTRLNQLEKKTDSRFGDPENPLFVSVRLGTPFSLPGMGAILNLGFNPETANGFGVKMLDECLALECYARFLTMFGETVLGVKGDYFDAVITRQKEPETPSTGTDRTKAEWQSVLKKIKSLLSKHATSALPVDPMQQLQRAIEMYFRHWKSDTAKALRKFKGTEDDSGVAVTVQAMVFGNKAENSVSGNVFTRSPATGERKLFGEYRVKAQGVGGVINDDFQPIDQLKKDMPEVFESLEKTCQKLENHYQKIQELEFVVDSGKLYFLQTRSGQCTAFSEIKIAVDMVTEGLISKREAVMRVPPERLEQIFHPMVDPKAKIKALGQGLGASPGAAFGKAVFTPEAAQEHADRKEKVILIRAETTPEDIHGMNVAQGILTAKGGMTSHAAVVTRAMGKPCVAACAGLVVDVKRKRAHLNGVMITEKDSITLDGTGGRVIAGEIPLIQPRMTSSFSRLMTLAAEFRKISVRANADTPHDALVAREFGAEGIGLCRTEHMFFNTERILLVRRMILANSEKERGEALKKLLPIQRNDFTEIFKAMEGLPVTIRLLDPPLHEFLSSEPTEVKRLAKELNVSAGTLAKQIASLREINPMLGHRGCRLGMTYPEIYRMQARAILEAAGKLVKKNLRVAPEIMIPLVSHVAEFKRAKQWILEEAEEVQNKSGIKIPFKIGTMIELPRAALTADEIAEEADFFSFGTNDLTQTTLGISRDDSGGFLPYYLEQGVWDDDPFVTLDKKGVGRLIQIGVEKGKLVKKKLQIGICGEHAADTRSIEFFNALEVDYISCSPFRVSSALLGAAQAQIKST
ncbi:MAG: pyruvate, phosphate dikinase [Nitrospinae bacterium CG11_big_fil_rev_8_21_14_0_20_45_15]|nr:MAG: pyruvate, phosphate dikinase [Nitrospinae bacterium CG11_big_fil_rev_8_21_14_0_20_45_15]